MLVEVEEAPPIGSEVEVTILNGYDLRKRPDAFTLLAEVRHLLAWSFIAPAGQQQLRGVGLRFISALESPPVSGWLH